MDFSEGVFQQIYENEVSVQKERYLGIIENFKKYFDDSNCQIFSVPGRTELSGNHTDHNNGRVIAAGINLDSVAAAAANGTSNVKIYSEGFDEHFKVDLNSLDSVEDEKGSTASLIRGTSSKLKDLGYQVGGFNAYLTSNVLIGSGLSSSASIEVLIGTVFNHLFNDGKIDPVVLAKVGQYAENNFFGKPCGLMDQMACAVGGILGIDFKDPDEPEYEKIDIDFAGSDYKLIIVDTGGSHADLTDDYAAVPHEMKTIAEYFGVKTCRELIPEKFFEEVPKLLESINHRAILRAYHFINENLRVTKQMEMLRNNNVDGFVKLVNDSGDSSFKWLQNIYSPQDYKHQAVSIGLAMADSFINEKGSGAARIHGGGFAGTIQAFIKDEYAEEFVNYMGRIFGLGSVNKLSIRNHGAVKVF